MFPSKNVPNCGMNSDQRIDQPWHWGSGDYAVLLASEIVKQIHPLGFDLFGTEGVNNRTKIPKTM